MDLDKILTSMFGLILVFIIVSRANDVNTLVGSIGGFITRQTQALQGVSPGILGNSTLVR